MPMKTLTILSLLLLIGSPALADPVISGVSGTVAHGNPLTITGTGFGAKTSAAPLWWDNASGASEGLAVPSTGEMTWVTSTLTGTNKHYNSVAPTAVTQFSGVQNIKYRSSYRGVSPPHSRTSYFMTGAHAEQFNCAGGQWNNGMDVGVTIGDTSRHTEWYVSYYLRLDDNWASPNGTENYKYVNWDQCAPRTTMYCGSPCYSVMMSCACSTGGGIKRSAPACNEAYINGPSQCDVLGSGCPSMSGPTCGYPVITHNYDKPNPKYSWVKMEHILDWDGNYYKETVNRVTLLDTSLYGGCSVTTAKTTPGSVTVGGFFKSGVDCGSGQHHYNDDNYRYFADLYVDTTLARVELCDAATYSGSTVCEPQIPSSWSTTSIGVTVNSGAIPDGTGYLYVITTDNVPSAGYSVTVGGCVTDGDCDDANDCTDDACNDGTCEFTNNTADCDDSLWCNGTDTCSGGSCGHQYTGDGRCSAGADCNQICNETADNCYEVAGTSCDDEVPANPFTLDQCNGTGACVHTPIGGGPGCVMGVSGGGAVMR
jgi:hypothetical protein